MNYYRSVLDHDKVDCSLCGVGVKCKEKQMVSWLEIDENREVKSVIMFASPEVAQKIESIKKGE